ncbi:MAG: hypothetical protein RMK52_05675 [Chitinophagales bacterium]|nr:hypothetical protein [Chitinophagales bacterium]MDW8393717.1 hypothetical protein [Chitinophagales bacterium]
MPFRIGEIVSLDFVVTEADTATFATGTVHAVYSTFALARDAEWTTRQFILRNRRPGQEGIGTMVSVRHKAPAFVGECVTIKGRITSYRNGHLRCSFRAYVGKRLIATGQTGQLLLPVKKLRKLLDRHRINAAVSP